MATRGDLVVNLSANASKFNQGLQQAAAGARSFAGSVVSLFNPINLSLDGIVAKAAAAGLSFYGIASRIEALAKISDKAAQTGLSGVFIQRLGYAADQSGISAETLTGAIEKMTVTLGKAEMQSEETQNALAQIGLTSDELQAMSPDEQFLAIADAIGKLPTIAQRAAASTALFGKSAMEMGSLFADGKKGIVELMAEAEKLNIGISDEDLKSIATADDAIERMKTTFSDVLSKVTVGLAPAFESMANNLTEIIPKIAEVAKGISSGIGESLKSVGEYMAANIIPPVKEFLTVSSELVTKWAGMENKWKFLGQVIAEAFRLGIEHIKVYWKQMLDDMIAWTAEKAAKMLDMLNPKKGAIAIADWLAGQSRTKAHDADGNSLALAQAEARFANLMRQLNGEAPLPIPGSVSAVTPSAVLSEAERRRNAAMSGMVLPGGGTGFDASGMPGGSMNVAPGGKSPEVKATEEQTKKLADAFAQRPAVQLNVVSGF